MTTPTRRHVLAWGALGAATLAGLSTADPARAADARHRIRPREAWAAGLSHPDPLPVEDDVTFLLVHHTETPNGDSPEGVVRRLRSIHAFHTGEKGWKDVAYNFFVDAYGRIWEGRAGSLEAPVRGDATGGSQGHAILCCFVGDHSRVPPTEAAQAAMGSLLGRLAVQYGVDLAAPSVTFVSRGSNRWPAGSTVRTAPLSGHRDVSRTECPGDAAYTLVHGSLLTRAQDAARLVRRGSPGPSSRTSAATAPSPVVTTATTAATAPAVATAAPSGTGTSSMSPPSAPSTTVTTPATPPGSPVALAPTPSPSAVSSGAIVEDGTTRGMWAAAGGVAAATVAALAIRGHARTSPMPDTGDEGTDRATVER